VRYNGDIQIFPCGVTYWTPGNNEDILLKDKLASLIINLLLYSLSIFKRTECIRISKRLFNGHKDINNSTHDKLENIIRRISFGNRSNVVIILSK